MTTTFRADEGLAFLLQYENVAWYDAGDVRILDPRVYPAKTEFVTYRTHGAVAQASSDMVTQSAGPYTGLIDIFPFPRVRTIYRLPSSA